MRNSLWIVVSLFIHFALGSVLWFSNHETPPSLSEEVVDLTLSAPAVENKNPAPVKPKALAPAAVAATVKDSLEDSKPTTETNSDSSSTETTEDTGGSTPVGWGEVTRFPKVSKEVKASYPVEAKKAGVDGPVVLDVLIDRTGKVREVKIVSGPGFGLNESAIEALKKFEFQPAQKGAESVAVKIRYTYRFKLGVN
ncbi:energy transducer TonB [Bdellovibrio bacteriovorus]|uniref:energy transducer TonB n=1 Tax=Bdellovibrio TaxID=958 RepID=UPI0035A8BB9B